MSGFEEYRAVADRGDDRPLKAVSDHKHRTIDDFTSTPHQPANACFAPSLPPNVADNGPMQALKMRKIKGLPRKPLK